MIAWETSISSRRYVGASSRYARSKVRYYGEDKFITFETYKRKEKRLNANDKWFEITIQHEYRPDLLSTDIYGSPDFWWALLEHNGMKDIFEFKAGKTIRIPQDMLFT